MALRSTGRDRIESGVRTREAFKHGNVRGEWFDTGANVPLGQARVIPNVVGAVFVIFSYSTPIAWYSPVSGWTSPDVKYSVTTTNHQSVVRGAIARVA